MMGLDGIGGAISRMAEHVWAVFGAGEFVLNLARFAIFRLLNEYEIWGENKLFIKWDMMGRQWRESPKEA